MIADHRLLVEDLSSVDTFEVIFETNRPSRYQRRRTERGVPFQRSGHRCFTDDDYLYLIGGFNTCYDGSILAEFWAFNLTSRRWRRYETDREFPNELASFSIAHLGQRRKEVLLFGGSGSQFGDSSSNKCYILQVDNENCVVRCKKLETAGTPPIPKYGHSMCMGEKKTKFYVTGGTTGLQFNLDVHSLEYTRTPETETTSSEGEWKWTKLNKEDDIATGRYKFESTYDEKTGLLLFLGGGTMSNVFGFEEITAFDTKKEKYTVFHTFADERELYPEARRCFSLTRYGRDLIIVGGATKERRMIDNSGVPFSATGIFFDAWVLNLDTRKWRVLSPRLKIPVFFHDAAITSDGMLMVSGGVDSTMNLTRINAIQMIRIDIAPLQTMAIDCIRKFAPSVFSGYYGETLVQSSDISHIVRSVLSEDYAVEQSKNVHGRYIVTKKGEKKYDNGRNIDYFKRHHRSEAYFVIGCYPAHNMMKGYMEWYRNAFRTLDIVRSRILSLGETVTPITESREILEERKDRIMKTLFNGLRYLIWKVENFLYREHRNFVTDPAVETGYDAELETLLIRRYDELANVLGLRSHRTIYVPNDPSAVELALRNLVEHPPTTGRYGDGEEDIMEFDFEEEEDVSGDSDDSSSDVEDWQREIVFDDASDANEDEDEVEVEFEIDDSDEGEEEEENED